MTTFIAGATPVLRLCMPLVVPFTSAACMSPVARRRVRQSRRRPRVLCGHGHCMSSRAIGTCRWQGTKLQRRRPSTQATVQYRCSPRSAPEVSGRLQCCPLTVPPAEEEEISLVQEDSVAASLVVEDSVAAQRAAAPAAPLALATVAAVETAMAAAAEGVRVEGCNARS